MGAVLYAKPADFVLFFRAQRDILSLDPSKLLSSKSRNPVHQSRDHQTTVALGLSNTSRPGLPVSQGVVVYPSGLTSEDGRLGECSRMSPERRMA